MAAGADLSPLVVALQAVGFRDAKQGKLREATFSLATDLGVLEELIASLGDCRLVVIDPITAYLGSADSHNNAEMRSLLAPLSAVLAARTGVALLAINHLNKANQGPAIYRSMGSVAFAATARSTLAVLADPYDPSTYGCWCLSRTTWPRRTMVCGIASVSRKPGAVARDRGRGCHARADDGRRSAGRCRCNRPPPAERRSKPPTG